jgi:NO-binding membrane sensor protein with MHYT domain
MEKHYDLLLVAYSFIIATLTGYCGIEMTARVRRAVGGGDQTRWILGAAFGFGTGVWAMHFMGMAALVLGTPLTFDAWVTAGSWLVAVVVSAIGFYVIRNGVRVASWLLASTLMAAGVCLMHYSGMYALHMMPGITYVSWLFWLSVVIAFGACAAALLIMTWLRQSSGGVGLLLRVGAALVMAVAVTGMHYTGMAAAMFEPGSYCSPANQLADAWVILGLVMVATAAVSLSQWTALLD